MDASGITFSFGRNWNDYVEEISDTNVTLAIRDIEYWLGQVRGKSVIDVGSGSGINSLSFCRLGAKSVRSFDYDPYSVKAAKKLRARHPAAHWTIEQGSVLDDEYIASLGTYDVVYSWGVLHHTGDIWHAIGNCSRLVARGGTMWIALYAKGPRYAKDLALKQRFNAASPLGKRVMIARKVLRKMASQVKHGKNPLAWNHTVNRGMNVYYDIVDWLGGLPYETAKEDEVVRFARKAGLVLERIEVKREGDLNQYVFRRAQAVRQSRRSARRSLPAQKIAAP